MDARGVEAREARLGEVAVELMRLQISIRRDLEGGWPLLWLDRLAIADGLGDAVAGLETARLALVRAGIRMRG